MAKSPQAFRTISEVASELGVRQHVLRFWESKFSQIKPMKRGGGRRYYRPDDVDLLKGIRQLLYGEGYSIRGVQKILRAYGARAVIEAVRAGGDIIAHITQGGGAVEPASAMAPTPAADEAPAATAASDAEPAGIPAAMVGALQTILAELKAARAALAEPD